MAPIFHLRAAVVLLFAVLGFSAASAGAVRLETNTGGHKAIIRAIAFTADGKQLLSAGDDKAIRVWDLDKAETIRTIRGEAGAGDEGKIFAMALSPDGSTIAVGGRLGAFTGKTALAGEPAHWIRLHDFATGAVKAVLKGHEDVIDALAFSPDGKQLISGSADKSAIIWDVAKGAVLHRLKGHAGPVSGAAFLDNSNAVTSSFDKSLKLWNAKTGTSTATISPNAERITSLAVSAATGVIASGGADGQIVLLDGKTGKVLRELAKQKSEAAGLAFSADGASLVSGAGAGGSFDVSVWDAASGVSRATYTGHDEIVLAAAFSPGGKTVATAGGQANAIVLWDPATGKPLKSLSGGARRVWAAGFSADGGEIAWGHSFARNSGLGRGPYEMRLRLPLAGKSLGEPGELASSDSAYIRGKGDFGPWSLSLAAGGSLGLANAALEIRRGGEVQATIVRGNDDGYRHTSYTFATGGERIVSGGAGGALSDYDLSGQKIGNFVGHEGEIWAVTPSPDGRFIVSGGSDGAVRLWNSTTHELIVSLLEGKNGEWVIWTPQGYYTSSPSGDALVGWQVNRGFDKAADYYTAAQLKQHFFRPDIVSRAIEAGSAENAIAEKGNAKFDLQDLLQRRPPELTILEPSDKAEVAQTRASLRIKVSASDDRVTAWTVTVNGRQVTPIATRGLTAIDDDKGVRDLEIPLVEGQNIVRVAAKNAVGESSVERLLFHKGEGELGKKGKLFIVAVGVDRYEKLGDEVSLAYAGADAKSFSETIAERAKPLYDEVKSVVLTTGADTPPTRPNIEDALALFAEAGPDDTSVLFLSGHGVNEGADYLYLPEDAEALNGKWRASSVVRWVVLQYALQSTQGRRLMFVDTCHSGNAYNARLAKDAVDSKIIVFSATDANTLAIERSDIEHGVFTMALIDGMNGGADFAADGDITVLELGSFVASKVAKLTSGAQKPAFHIAGATDFPLVHRK